MQRSTPDWLPFRPGSSFWVPPRSPKSLNVVDLVSKLANPMTEEEQLSLTTVRGWPSSEFFVQGMAFTGLFYLFTIFIVLLIG